MYVIVTSNGILSEKSETTNNKILATSFISCIFLGFYKPNGDFYVHKKFSMRH